ncbi:subunit alpha of mRNA capping enzyme [Ordospora colligata]|uniref:mRNA guanylyltransferase n=1 Tax=Ordospora colligata OC4 TaxID=1354746 RepID=A0A0B2ULE2_9MICR|nr:subunit alpha of mRNA capping enzyme [Ordospora colligata OC4]KHN69847.1 subunit alpha of mRNA capping enzyme [Ordospora colligata OC4]TBU16017.1 subunit alpha of mRNA capping enzyme [Ordospora colligata]TBU16230.1 subunit alpha of mRNA capping enzyme [Ordospora colligata]TBU18934.1 subunit alpha of mRNA capping enzyme [Ordospora colligata]
MELSCLGSKASPETASALRHMIYDQLNEHRAKHREKFVGSHPITLTLENINLLLTEDFLVCEKSDGVRALLLIINYMDKNRAYLYDRKNDFYELDIRIPFNSTVLIDGEVFLESNTINTYAIFDCLIYEGVSQISKNLYKRLGYAQMFLEAMYKEYETSKSVPKDDDRKRVHIQITNESPPICFYVKQMLKGYGFWEIYKKIPELKHGNDGLIFTPVNEAYCVGKRGEILKWKPASLNTMDFKMVRHSKDSNIYDLICIGKRGKEMVFDQFLSTNIHESNLDGVIGEFLYDADGYYWDFDELVLRKGGWKLYKTRLDKDSPNNIKVVCNILESLKDDLSIEKLSSFYTPMRENSKAREIQGHRTVA